jgi:hypothetical protein
MQADDSSTMRAGPFLIFFEQKSFYTHGLNANSVFDQTDMVSQPVPFIDLLDIATGKRCTFKTKINLAAEGAISYLAPPAVGGLAIFLPPAALASSLFPEMCITHRTIHATRCQHVDWYL